MLSYRRVVGYKQGFTTVGYMMDIFYGGMGLDTNL